MHVKLAYGKKGLTIEAPAGADIVEPAFVPGVPDEVAALRDALRGLLGGGRASAGGDDERLARVDGRAVGQIVSRDDGVDGGAVTGGYAGEGVAGLHRVAALGESNTRGGPCHKHGREGSRNEPPAPQAPLARAGRYGLHQVSSMICRGTGTRKGDAWLRSSGGGCHIEGRTPLL